MILPLFARNRNVASWIYGEAETAREIEEA